MTRDREPDPETQGFDGGRGDLEGIIADYLDRLNAGETLDPKEILAAHPGIGHEILKVLQEFLNLEPDQWGEREIATLGDYRLVRRIGRGGMGVVYEAWQNSMERRVALKVLPSGMAADGRTFARFMREAKTAGKLSHPNVVSVHAAGFDENTPYYAMEFVEGETLAKILARIRTGRVPAADGEAAGARTLFEGDRADTRTYADIAEAFAGVADGLRHAHENGVVHRDIKPSNLILDAAGRLRILDFGLARQEGQASLTRSGDFVGTPFYMSPEQARVRRNPIDHRTDIYSLGATMYETLTQEPPFRGKDSQDTLSQIVGRDPLPVRSREPRTPKDLETIVLKCIEKDPGDRYRTAEALAQDLRRFVRGDPIEASPLTARAKLLRRARRNRGKIAAAAAILVLLLGVAWQGLRILEEERRKRNRAYDEDVEAAVMKLVPNEFVRGAAAGGPATLDADLLIEARDLRPLLAGGGPSPVEEAAALLARASDSVPERVEAHYYFARALVFQGREDEALARLDRALAADPRFLPARILRAELSGEDLDPARLLATASDGASSEWASPWLEAQLARKAWDWERAIPAYEALIAIEQRSGDLYLGSAIEIRLGLGIAASEAGRFRRAVEVLNEVRGRWPEFLEPALLLGKVYWLIGNKEWAKEIFEDLHRRRAADDLVALSVVAVYRRLAAYDEALAWAARIREESVKERVTVILLADRGDVMEALRRARRLVEAHPSDPAANKALARIMLLAYYFPTSPLTKEDLPEFLRVSREAVRLDPASASARTCLVHALISCGEASEALVAAEQALAMHPKGSLTVLAKCAALIAAGDIPAAEAAGREAVRLAVLGANRRAEGLSRRYLGAVLIALGKAAEAIAEYEKAIQAAPESYAVYYALGEEYAHVGEYAKAAAVYRKLVDVAPTPAHRFRLALAQIQERDWDGAAEVLREALRQDPDDVWARCAMAVVMVHRGDALPPEEKDLLLARVEADLESLGQPLDETLLTALSCAKFVRGKKQEAILGLEELVRRPHANPRQVELLAELRKRIRPDMVTWGSIDASLEDWASDPDRDARLLAEFRAAASEPGAGDRIQYLDACLRRRAGRPKEAAEILARLASQDESSPHLNLRLAECLRAAGEPAAAEARLRAFLARAPGEKPEPWERWIDLCLNDLALAPEAVLARMPSESGQGADTRWLLQQLAAGNGIRINCGGEEYTDRAGTVWGADRFFRGGLLFVQGQQTFSGEIEGTDDDPLYQTERYFPRDEIHRAYRIPLPNAEYVVTLQIAEIWFRGSGARIFDVLIEGGRVLEAYEPLQAGFATAWTKAVPARVADGILDIEFIPRVEHPKISAIEIVRKS